jgi:hypothetical protein
MSGPSFEPIEIDVATWTMRPWSEDGDAVTGPS